MSNGCWRCDQGFPCVMKPGGRVVHVVHDGCGGRATEWGCLASRPDAPVPGAVPSSPGAGGEGTPPVLEAPEAPPAQGRASEGRGVYVLVCHWNRCDPHIYGSKETQEEAVKFAGFNHRRFASLVGPGYHFTVINPAGEEVYDSRSDNDVEERQSDSAV